MRTTLNIPDELVLLAKRRALEEGSTLTGLLVEGLRHRLTVGIKSRDLPVSSAAGGLLPGVDWMTLRGGDAAAEEFR